MLEVLCPFGKKSGDRKAHVSRPPPQKKHLEFYEVQVRSDFMGLWHNRRQIYFVIFSKPTGLAVVT